MTKAIFVSAALLFAGQPATAGTMSGNGALSFAALLGQHSPHLSKAEKRLLLKYLNGEAEAKAPKGKTVSVKADAVTCRISNVDITFHSCDLTFAGRKVALKGRAAHEIYATLVENGVPGDGAAGSIYEAIGAVDCRIAPAEVVGRGGGGAQCDYAAAK
ncbi:hypothetical protein K9U39_05295 [Rhodoblastus acidophilus]|uniref:Uncharacterized protein n=1 Tax=Candidatus Rhodoblastus alkanivorans TaxID=2954117 RepID=A0ABS9Z796_9HYPH|nr:hypothetical protein [Candidatus Rhodoblastus alkanivorans]MCI4678648.1 hypothetical protein [Candidatus Rhodoblastus alkanivorans]MCI4683057.1 hypothetical protein [Candidatus Rhodoblastus alkanivorans]MDI4640368.1 hypothetical protein [Rhodoblastus acidophilus]